MAKIKNKRIFNSDQTILATLREEYASMGFDTGLDLGCLTVYTRRRRKPKSKDKKEKERREERFEKE